MSLLAEFANAIDDGDSSMVESLISQFVLASASTCRNVSSRVIIEIKLFFFLAEN
jgi:hypothetical protein